MKQKKALIMTPTFFTERDYRESGCGAAIERLVDDFGFRYPGIETVEHVYFYAVGAVDDEARRELPAAGVPARTRVRVGPHASRTL